MAENCSVVDCSIDCGSEGVSTLLANEKGRNKRKFLCELSVDVQAEVTNESGTEVPRYEMLEEKFRTALNELGSLMERSEDSVEEQDEEESQDSDWDDPVTSQLEELLTNNLYATFCSAVKKIAENGYSEEVAEWAVLNSSLFHGSKDAVSNVVDSALTVLKREKEITTTKHPVFEGLQSLVDYTLLEMIYVLREVRPSMTVLEAMWCLLLSDLNLVNACVTEDGSTEASGESQTLPQSKSEASGTEQPKDGTEQKMDSDNLGSPKPATPQDKGSEKESSLSFQEAKGNLLGVVKEHIQTLCQGNAMDEKLLGNRKGLSINSKRDLLRQKAYQFEKNYKGRLSKGAFKAKVAAWGSMVLDKSLRAQSGCSSIAVKGVPPKTATSAGGNSSPVVEGKDPAVNSKSDASSIPDAPKSGADAAETPKATDYYASIPFDETLQKYIPQDDKDEAILLLVPHKQEIEKELQGWTEWANEKVMQAARRLGKDKAELKMLRQEKEEIEKFKKEKQALEESTMKRLTEMEHALTNATGQIEVAIRRLEDENGILKNEMEAATNLQLATEREQESLKKLQSWDAEKSAVQDQLKNIKSEIVALKNRLDKARERQNQFKVRILSDVLKLISAAPINLVSY